MIVFDEIDILVSKRNYTYSDCMNMPVSDRKYFIHKYIEEQQKIQEEIQKEKSKTQYKYK